MPYWMATVSADRYRAERLYQHDELDLSVTAAIGDELVLLAPGSVVFALARVVGSTAAGGVADDPDDAAEPAGTGPARLAYLRLLDEPVPADRAGLAGVTVPPAGEFGPLPVERYAAVRASFGRRPHRRDWMVSLDLPIEAASPAEAVRVFWSYVRSLGPAELPAFVWPSGDELAMRPYVLGVEHDMDPEDD